METFLAVYVLVGLVIGLIVIWASFAPDYDKFIREEFGEEPPDATEKIITAIGATVFWPLYLWKAFT